MLPPLIFGLISWAVGLVFMRSQWSLPSAVPFSSMSMPPSLRFPFPFSASEETKQIGIGYLKNFAAATLAGVVMVLILYLYPHLVTALAVSGGLGKAEMLGLAQGVETFDSFGVIIKTIAVLITTMMGLVKSGSWAKETSAHRRLPKPATAHRRACRNRCAPSLISYYWEPSEGFRWKGTRYGI